MKIQIFGSINRDLCLSIDRLPLPGESVMGQKYAYSYGGKGANQAVAVARLGGNAAMAGKIGADEAGKDMLAYLQRQGIDTAGIAVDQAAQTGLAVILLDEAGQNTILIFANANEKLTAEEAKQAIDRKAGALMMQMEVPDEPILAAAWQAHALGVPVVLDAGPARPFPLEKLPPITILSPNETETLALTGIDPKDQSSIEKAGEILFSRSRAQYIVLKLGSRGAALYTEGKASYFPGLTIQAVDPTAAGDAFTAAMTLRFLETGDIGESIRFGNFVGAMTATRKGASISIPTREEVEAWRAAYGEKI